VVKRFEAIFKRLLLTSDEDFTSKIFVDAFTAVKDDTSVLDKEWRTKYQTSYIYIYKKNSKN